MKIIILLSFFICSLGQAEGFLSKLFSSVSGEPAFMKNQPLNQAVKEYGKKFQNGLYPGPCYPWIKKIEKGRGEEYKCYGVYLANGAYYRDEISVATKDEKVVLFSRLISGNNNLVFKNSPAAVEEFGAESPTKIFEYHGNDSIPNTRHFNILWQLKNGFVHAQVLCPVTKYAGKNTIPPLRNCKMFNMYMSAFESYIDRLKEEETNKSWLAVSEEF